MTRETDATANAQNSTETAVHPTELPDSTTTQVLSVTEDAVTVELSYHSAYGRDGPSTNVRDTDTANIQTRSVNKYAQFETKKINIGADTQRATLHLLAINNDGNVISLFPEPRLRRTGMALERSQQHIKVSFKTLREGKKKKNYLVRRQAIADTINNGARVIAVTTHHWTSPRPGRNEGTETITIVDAVELTLADN